MRLLLVDGHYFLYRSFFAIRGLKNSKGKPTNAIYGFIKALRKMIADVKPDRAAVIWDSGMPARRVELQPAYKQNRTEMPGELRPQEDWLQERMPLIGLRSLWLSNTEADDLIASYALAARRDGVEVVIATNDKDIMQLVGEGISIYASTKGGPREAGFALLGEGEVFSKWGVPPARIADVLVLTGDASDNIPGVPGVGPKTAVSLVEACGTVERMLEHPETIANPKLREKISIHSDLIVANREMVRLDDDLPLPVPWRELVIEPKYPELIAALRECEFGALLREVEAEAAKSGKVAPAQGELFPEE
jgi:DNA polymerase-1